MLIATTNDVPGYDIYECLGEVFGLTVRSRNAFSNMGAGLKSIVGGELKGMTKNLETSRQEVIQRMAEAAAARGANAVVAMRFDTSEMGGQWTEICAYGTAVKIVPRGQQVYTGGRQAQGFPPPATGFPPTAAPAFPPAEPPFGAQKQQ